MQYIIIIIIIIMNNMLYIYIVILIDVSYLTTITVTTRANKLVEQCWPSFHIFLSYYTAVQICNIYIEETPDTMHRL